MCFAAQRRAIFHLSSGQLAPHPPFLRGYFSTLRRPKSLEKTQWIATSLPFSAPASSLFWLSPLSSHFLTSPLWLFPPLLFHLCILLETSFDDCNYTPLITLHHNYNSTTLQLRLQLQYTTLHPAVAGEPWWLSSACFSKMALQGLPGVIGPTTPSPHCVPSRMSLGYNRP